MIRYDDTNDAVPMRDVGKHNLTTGATAELYEDFEAAGNAFEAAAAQFEAAAEYMQERQAAMTERAAQARARRVIVQDFPDPMPDPNADWHEASREAARDRRSW